MSFTSPEHGESGSIVIEVVVVVKAAIAVVVIVVVGVVIIIIIVIIIIVIIYPITARVVGAPQMISQPVSSIFPCSPLPSGTCQTPGLSIP